MGSKVVCIGMDNRKLIEHLKKKAAIIRRDVLKMVYEANSGHPGGSLSAADMIGVLYSYGMNIDPKRPHWPERDRFILSKGHACPAYYAALARRGYFPTSQLRTLRQMNGILQGHPDMNKVPGVDMTTGSLGQGLSAGVGMALAAKLDKKNYRVHVLVGDGELNEGQVWEAVMFAAKYKLDNLTVFLDRNGLQLDGSTEEIMPLEPLETKFKAFNWNVVAIDGNDVEEILRALAIARRSKNKPTWIIAKTIKGKGVSFMEGKPEWHGKIPDQQELLLALKELGVN